MKPSTIILIDDDVITNTLCEFVLKETFDVASVTTFVQSEDALTHILNLNEGNDASPVVIFLDINMPTMSGWDVLNELQNTNVSKEHFLIYILSSSVDERDRDRALSYPIVKGYLVKPITADVLQKIF